MGTEEICEDYVRVIWKNLPTSNFLRYTIHKEIERSF